MPEGKRLTMALSKEQADQIAAEVERFSEWEVRDKIMWQDRWCLRIKVKYYPEFYIGSMAEWRKIRFKHLELMLIADEARKLGLRVDPMVGSNGVLYLEIDAPRDHPLGTRYEDVGVGTAHEFKKVREGFSMTRVGGLSTWNKIMGPLEDRTELTAEAVEAPEELPPGS